ncbi:hypothetical protein DPMN_111978 [Dreissena polymorpha]|uniref:Uncharacterized protein n=1 Tax=Dreissena polymorpha TaxID=45954 RepID=A0A9D4KFF7_DREPO|nr:hypothetical protein DPMN_111978 [Dreissena polymorpha]
MGSSRVTDMLQHNLSHAANTLAEIFAHLRGFHDDWAKNVTSRKTAPPGSHVIQLTGTIFKLNSHSKETNVLTKFHENWAKNVTFRMFTCFHYIHIEKNALPTGGNVFSPLWTIFELENCPPSPPGSHVIQLTGTIFELNSHIKETNVLTKFHEHWAKNVTSREFTCFHYIHIEKNAPPTGGHVFSPIWTILELVRDIMFTRKTAPPNGGHVFQRTGTTFKINQRIIKTNILTNFELDRDFIGTKLLTKFHEDRTINVASRVFTNKYEGQRPVTKAHLCNQAVLIQDIIGTNHLTKFHKYRKKNVASTVLTRKNAPPHGSHVFQPTGIIFYLFQDVIGMNLLTKCYEDRTINVASRVLTRFYYSHIRKNAPPLGSHTNLLTKFHEDWSINVASRVLTRKNAQDKCHAPDIIGTNRLTKFYDDRKINVTSRVLTRKNAQPRGGHVFQPTCINFKLVQDIIRMNHLTKFHEDWTINVASKVKYAPPLGSHVFRAKVTIFELIQDIIGTNLLTKFHEDRKINVVSRDNAPPPGGHVFQPTRTIFELVQDIIEMNLLTTFHENQTINVALKNAPPLGSHVFQANKTIFVLIQDIIETNLLTKFHEDWTIIHARIFQRIYWELIDLILFSTNVGTNHLISGCRDKEPKSWTVLPRLGRLACMWTINVASRELTRQMLVAHDRHILIVQLHD